LVLVALGRTVAAFAFAVLEGVLVGILSHLWNS
jgi:ABC-type nitrate/sulfonate/bicarbonate transport system permease component